MSTVLTTSPGNCADLGHLRARHDLLLTGQMNRLRKLRRVAIRLESGMEFAALPTIP